MIEWLIVTVLIAAALAGGLYSGGASGRKNLVGRIVLSAVVWGVIAAGVAGLVAGAYIKPDFEGVIPMRSGCCDPLSYDFGEIITSLWFAQSGWRILLGSAGAALPIGWLALLCRRTVASIWPALAVVVLAAPLWLWSLLWGWCGWLIILVLSVRFSEKFPVNAAAAVLAVVVALMLSGWTFYLTRRGCRGWRVLLILLGVLIGSNFLCWGLASAVTMVYVKSMRTQAAEHQIAVCMLDTEPSPQAAAIMQPMEGFYDRYPLFQLPNESVRNWVKGPDVKDKDMVTPQEREFTLQFFDSPEARKFHEARWAYINYRRQNYIELWQAMRIRAHNRFGCGRAALFGETGQPEKILPELVPLMAIDRQMLDRQPLLIVELIRIACRFMWCQSMVSLGPDDVLSTEVYREALTYLKSCKVYLPDESCVYLGLLDRCQIKNFQTFFIYPLIMAHWSKGLQNNLKIIPELRKIEKYGYDGMPLPWGEKFLERAATNSQSSITICTTAMALKLYRSEEGKYPATLAELVPKYLDQLPVSPFPGYPLNYETDGKDFALTLTAPNGSNFKISSQKDY